MANDVFYVQIRTNPKIKTYDVLKKADSQIKTYGFSCSVTGMLDFTGAEEPSEDVLAQMQCVEGSSYFTPSWYTYLPKELQAAINVYIPQNIKNLDSSHYSFLLHIGALLLAVDTRDTLLVASLLQRRSAVFANYMPIVLHIIKPIAAEALFAYVYGGFNKETAFTEVYTADTNVSTGETNVCAILFAAARDTLKPVPHKESIDEMFIRYFETNSDFNFTIGIVGATNHSWVDGLDMLTKFAKIGSGNSFANNPTAAGQKMYDMLSMLTTQVQAEIYNTHDHNAIAVYISDLAAEFKGMHGTCKAGYLRATGASILRKAKPNLLSFKSELWRIGADATYFENAIVLRLKF